MTSLPRITVSRAPTTRGVTAATLAIKGMITQFDHTLYKPARARLILEIHDTVLHKYPILLCYRTFANAFLAKCFEHLDTPEFDEHIPQEMAYERIQYHACLILARIGLGSLLEDQDLPYVNGHVLEYALLKNCKHGDDVLAVAEGLAQHRVRNRAIKESIEANASPDDPDHVLTSIQVPRPREVGHRCRVAFEGYYHAAKITWMSRSRRTCRYVFAEWWGPGWESEEHTAFVKDLHDYDCVGYVM